MRQTKSNFWSGFGIGATIGTAAVLLPQVAGRAGASRIIRLEKSIQIGRPVEEVFNAWIDWDRLPRVSDNIADIRHHGDRSHWRVQFEGQTFEWDALIEQKIPNQAIGWKSVGGIKHTGRVVFAPLANDTVVLVTMNYAPPSRLLRPLLSPMAGHMEGMIEKVLRDFKASVESRPWSAQGSAPMRTGSEKVVPTSVKTELPKTGTFGNESRQNEPRHGGTANAVDFTAPSDAKR